MSGIKFYNFAIPVDMFKKLKIMSNRTGVPISEMLREAISQILARPKIQDETRE